MGSIRQSYANSLRLTDVPNMIVVRELTIGSKDFTTVISIRLSSATTTLIRSANASMATSAASLTLLKISRCVWSIKWLLIQTKLCIATIRVAASQISTSTCFTSRQSGALSTKNITKPSVYTRIISKISVADQIYSRTRWPCARTGRAVRSSLVTKKDVKDSKRAATVTGGKSNYSIHICTKRCRARSRNASRAWSAHTITLAATAVKLHTHPEITTSIQINI